MKRLPASLAMLALLLGIQTASAEVITFAGLSGIEAPIPNGYGGFNWNNFSSLDTIRDKNALPSGYSNASVDWSNPYVAFNRYGADASISRAAPFTFVAGFFTGAWRDGLNIEVIGSLGGSTVYDTTFQVNSTAPTFQVFNYAGIDKLTFRSYGGTVHGYVPGAPNSHPPGTQFAMDDLIFTPGGGASPAAFGNTPEPASLVLVAVGGACVGIGAWARRRRGERQHS